MASRLFLEDGLHAPYFIFLQCAGRFTDSQLLTKFGLGRYQPATAEAANRGRYAILADDGPWKLLADDWYYTLWHLSETRPTIEALAQECDIFACSVGDCDRSFDFVYYHQSRLVRKYVVADPHFRGGVVVQNVGYPLPAEAAALQLEDEMKIVLSIAASLGIQTNYTQQNVRIYEPPPGAERSTTKLTLAGAIHNFLPGVGM
jgi:hypothetical protein